MAKKVSEADFWAYMMKYGCMYSMVAEALKKDKGINITRQAVSQRAKKKPEKEQAIKEAILDQAEAELYNLTQSADTDATKLRALEFYLKKKGRERGYGDDPTVSVQQINVPNKKEINYDKLSKEALEEIIALAEES